MCANCFSTAEAVAAQLAFAGYLAERPLHRVLARFGLVAKPDPLRHDAHTVQFLRRLELDPVVILGAETVAAADAWRPVHRPRRARKFACARPIGSHNFISTA